MAAYQIMIVISAVLATAWALAVSQRDINKGE